MNRSYRLGGVSPTPWITRRRIIQGTVLIAIAVAMAVLVLATQNPWLAIAFIAVGALAWGALQKRTDLGDLWLLDAGDRARNLLGRWGGWDDFHPSSDPAPWLCPPMTLHSLHGPQGSELGLLDYGAAMVAVLEVSGDGDGVRNASSMARLDDTIIATHEELARPETCVEQVDWITMIRPQSAASVADLTTPKLSDTAAEELRQSWTELPQFAAAEAETVRSWLVVRFNVDSLFDRFARPPLDETSGARAAQDALGAVVRTLHSHGHQVLGALSLAQIGALTRSVLDPSVSPDDLRGIGADLWTGVPGWSRSRDGKHMASGRWLHSTASFARTDWPILAVEGRWLHPLLTRRSLGPRTIITQIRLIPRVDARRLARSQQTSAASKRLQNQGSIDGGEAQMEESTAAVITADLTVRGGVGIIPRVRILVSGKTERELRDRREALKATVVAEMAAESITFDQARPGAGLLTALPIGVEVPSE